MPYYLIQTRFANPAGPAEAIERALDQFDTCIAPMPNTWIIDGATSAEILRNMLTEHLAEGDALLILRIGHEGSWRNLDRLSHDWLNTVLMGTETGMVEPTPKGV